MPALLESIVADDHSLEANLGYTTGEQEKKSGTFKTPPPEEETGGKEEG